MQAAKTSHVRSAAVPLIMYGTAWKEDRTQALALEAIAAGFRALDTANQRKHYVGFHSARDGIGLARETRRAKSTATRSEGDNAAARFSSRRSMRDSLYP